MGIFSDRLFQGFVLDDYMKYNLLQSKELGIVKTVKNKPLPHLI